MKRQIDNFVRLTTKKIYDNDHMKQGEKPQVVSYLNYMTKQNVCQKLHDNLN